MGNRNRSELSKFVILPKRWIVERAGIRLIAEEKDIPPHCVAKIILAHITGRTDIVLDVSSFPRVAYLAIMTGLLHHLVPDKTVPNALAAGGVNLQVLVAEDSCLDSAYATTGVPPVMRRSNPMSTRRPRAPKSAKIRSLNDRFRANH